MSCAAIGGSTGQLLEQNAQAFNQISANLASLQVNFLAYEFQIHIIVASNINP